MIVVTAATRWEAAPLEKALKHLPGVKVLRTGMGPTNALQAVERLEFDRKSLTVISSGFAGALQPGVKCGDLVADMREAPLELVQSARATAERLKLPFHLGPFISTDHVAKPSEKRELGAKRGLAVDMESAALRQWAKEKGAVFLAVRAVLDEMDEELPAEVPGEGLAQAVKYAARHWKRLPLLARIGLRQMRAMDRLRDFLEEWLRSLP